MEYKFFITKPAHEQYASYSVSWVALRLDRSEIDWEEVGELLHESYRRIAPKRLAADIGIRCFRRETS